MRRVTLAAMPLFLLASTPALAGPGGWATASDVAVGGLAAWSLGVPLVQGDTRGAMQAGGSMLAAQAVAQGLKESVHETRPDGSDRRSFPSGHTSMAFAAATSILDRRGLAEGIPALAVASFVGVARVEARKHHWHDVLAGAAIGTASGLLITHPRPGTAVVAWGDTTGGGITYAARF